jgi:hypothetical protein
MRTSKDEAMRGLAGRLHFGVEVEVNTRDRAMNRALADLAELDTNGMFYCKSDSSIGSGFEVVSHPFTFTFMQENEDAFAALFKLRENCQGYSAPRCGMHVHMSSDAFSHFHLLKFIRFFYRNPAFIERVSRREPGRMDEWARCSLSGNDRDITIAKKEASQSARYSALNFQPRSTIECRIFRSTLSPRLFYGNIEFLKSAYDFTKSYGLNELSVDRFISHTRECGKMFKNFLGCLDTIAPGFEVEEMENA